MLALRMWGSPGWAAFAALLLAFDGLHIVQSRMAMLDIFLSTFIVAGFLFLVLDRERLGRAGASKWRRTTRLFGSPWRLWAGVALGAAVATKWSGFYALALAVLLCAVWSLRRDGPRDRSPAAEIATIALSLGAVPLLVYLASYGAFFFQHGFAVHDFITLQIRMLQYQQHHLKVQPENSRAWTWPLLLHPIRYFEDVRGTSVSLILALGNPVLWWGFLLSLPVAAFTALRRPRWQEAVAFGGYAAMFLPWFVVVSQPVHLLHAAGGPVHVPVPDRHAATAAGSVEPRRGDRVRGRGGRRRARVRARCGPGSGCHGAGRTRCVCCPAGRDEALGPAGGRLRRGDPARARGLAEAGAGRRESSEM